jgi:hypothetical protein
MCCTESLSSLKLIPLTSVRTIIRTSRKGFELMSMNVVDSIVFLSENNYVSDDFLSDSELTYQVVYEQ